MKKMMKDMWNHDMDWLKAEGEGEQG